MPKGAPIESLQFTLEMKKTSFSSHDNVETKERRKKILKNTLSFIFVSLEYSLPHLFFVSKMSSSSNSTEFVR